MANYFSVSSGNVTDDNVFYKSINTVDNTTNIAYKTLDNSYVYCLPIPGNNEIYGLAVHLYLRSVTPSGTFDLEIISPSGSVIATETYDISLFTKFDGRNNYITLHPQNWQILSLTAPINLTESGNYTLKFKTSENNQLSLMGESVAFNEVDIEKFNITGSLIHNSPFNDLAEEVVQGTLIPQRTLPTYGLGSGDFTVEGYYYFNTLNEEWNPLINYGPGWDKLVIRSPTAYVLGQYSAWGMAYNDLTKKIYLFRFTPRGEKVISAYIPLVTNKWYHIAASRTEDVTKLWVDGVCIYTNPSDRINYGALRNKKLQIGSLLKTRTIKNFPTEPIPLPQENFISNMCVSNIRITRNLDRYPTEFRPVTDPLSLRSASDGGIANTPFLYSYPYSDYYLTTDSSGTISEKYFDISAIVYNDIDELQFTRTGAATLPLAADNPFVASNEYSLNFSGSSFYTANVSYGNFTTGDFTIDLWINPSNVTSIKRICTYSTTGVTVADMLFGLEIENGVLAAFIVSSSKTKFRLLQGNIVTGQWQHVALVRQNTTLITYINGVATGASLTIPNKLNKLLNPVLTFGGQRDKTLFYQGILTNLRVIRGKAVYTSDFNITTPPGGVSITSPEPVADYTGNAESSGLLTVQPVVYDLISPSNSYICTATVATSPDSPVTGEYSMSLSKVSLDSVNLPLEFDSVANIGGTDFTVEAWIKLSTMPASNVTTSSYMLLGVSSSSTDGYGIFIGSTTIYAVGAGGTIKYAESTHSLSANAWNHISCVRKNGYLKFFVNGVNLNVISLFDITAPYTVTDTSKIFIGARNGTACFFDGLISNLRLIRGTSIYDSNFNVVPVVGGANISSPVPLTEYISTTGTGTYITSNTLRNSTNVPHAGIGSSLEFNKNVFIDITENDNVYFGSADFTIECWVHVDSAQQHSHIFGSEDITLFVGDNAGSADLSIRSVVTGVGTFIGTLTIGQWSHIALVRSGDSLSFYQDGTLLQTKTVNVSLGSSKNFSIGRPITSLASVYTFQGNLADIRIIRGTAVYPAAAFPTTSSTSSLGSISSTSSRMSMNDDMKLNPTYSASYPSSFISPYSSLAFNRSFTGIKTVQTANMSGDFTIEAWIKLNNTTIGVASLGMDIFAATGVWSFGVANTGGRSIDTNILHSQAVRLYFGTPLRAGNVTTQNSIYADSVFVFDVWTHVAVCRQNNQWYFYINGNLTSHFLGMVDDIRTKNFTSPGSIIIGRNVDGNIASALLTSGTAKYTNSFIPPTAPYTKNTNNEILFAAAENNSRLITNDAISFYGTDTDIFTSDIPSTLKGDFLIDFYIRPRNTKVIPEIWLECGQTFNGTTNLGLQIGINPPEPLAVQTNYNSFSKTTATNNERRLWVKPWDRSGWHLDVYISSEQCIVYNEWNHVAITRINGDISVTVNNVPQIAFTNNKPLETKLYVGSARPWPQGSGAYIKPTWALPIIGDISYVRIEKTATNLNNSPAVNNNTVILYTPNTGIDRYYANATSSFYLDQMPSPFAEDGSLYFTNTVSNSFLKRRHINDALLQTQPFTVEGWFYLTLDTTADSTLLSIWQNSDVDSHKPFIVGTRNLKLVFYVNSDGTASDDFIVTADPLKINTWYYFALCQDVNNDIRLHLGDITQDVAQLVGLVNNSSWSGMASTLNVKTMIAAGMTGYISNFRESNEALYGTDDDIDIPDAPFSVLPSTIALYKTPYKNNEYKYYEKTASILYKTNIDAFSADTPFEAGVDGCISKAYGIIPADFSPDLNIRTQDFTLEWWCNIKSYKNNIFPIVQFGSLAADANTILGVRFFQPRTAVPTILVRINAVEITLNIVGGITLNEWHHCAIVRSAGVLKLYIDGAFISSVYNASTSASIDTPTGDGVVGANYSTSVNGKVYMIDGSLSNVRLVVGSALYPGEDKPVAPLSNIPGTAFLYKAPYNNNYLSNDIFSTASILKTQSSAVFYASPDKTSDIEDCMFFNGTQYLQVPDNGIDFNVGSGNEPFTIELWALVLKASGTQYLLSRGGGTNSWSKYGNSYNLYLGGNILYFTGSVAGNTNITLSYNRFGLDKLRDWVHIAVTYDGAVTSMYVDGIRVASNSTNHSYNYTKLNTRQFKLGTAQHLLPKDATPRLFGYLSNIHIVKGTCLYSGSTPFTPASIISPVTDTKLLLKFPYNNSLEFKYQTSPFDSQSIESTPFIDGAKYLKTIDSLPQMTADFTIEFWFYCLRQNINSKTFIKESILDGRAAGSIKAPFVVRLNDTARKIRVYTGTSSPAGAAAEFIDVGAVVLKTWHHFVIQRENNIITFFQDGVACGSIYSTAIWGGNPLLIGKQYTETGYTNSNFLGYISNLRIVNNEAVYSTRKSVPISALQKDENTVFLLKTATDFDKCIITTESHPLTESVPPKINDDSLHYTAFTQASPWGNDTTDFLVFPGDGQGLYPRFIDNQAFNLNEVQFTFEAYIYHTVSSDNLCGGGLPGGGFVTPWSQFIFSITNFGLAINCEGFLSLHVNGVWYPSTVDVEAFEWIHIALVGDPTIDNGKITLYVNGENSFEWLGPTYLPPVPVPAILFIGTFVTEGYVYWSRGSFNPRFRGYMSNVRLMRGDRSRNIIDITGLHTFTNLNTTSVIITKQSPDELYPGSLFFNGGTRATLTSTTRADVFTGGFTIEMYVNLDLAAFTGAKTLIGQGADWYLRVYADGVIDFYARTANIGGTTVTSNFSLRSSAGAVVINEWIHIAVTRDADGDVFLYADSIVVATTNNTKQIGIPSTKSLSIGGTVKGFISNIRIHGSLPVYDQGIIEPAYPLFASPGDTLLVQPEVPPAITNYTPPYTADFTPPQGPLTKLPGTVLLLQAPHTTNSINVFTAYSATVASNSNPYTNSDAYNFNGNNYVYVGNHGKEGLYRSKFSISFWCKPEATSTVNRVLVHKLNNYTVYLTTSNRIAVTFNPSGTITGDVTLALNTWHYISVENSGSKIFLYINGILEKTLPVKLETYNITNLENPIVIGANKVVFGVGIPRTYGSYRGPVSWNHTPETYLAFTGKISDIHIQKGTTAISTDIVVSSDIFDVVSDTLLLHQPSYGNNVYTTSGGTQGFVLNTTNPSDISGISFAGDGVAYLKTQVLPACSSDATVEMWFYPTRATSTTEILLDSRNSATDIPFYIALNLNGTFNVGVSCGSRLIIKSANNSYTPNTWNHVAVIRTGSTIALYLNQKFIDMTKSASVWFNKPVFIGKSSVNTQPFKGKIYSIRIVKNTNVYNTKTDITSLTAPTLNNYSQLLITGNNLYHNDTGYIKYPMSSSTLLQNSPLGNYSPVTSDSSSILRFQGAEYIIVPHNELLDIANEPWSIEFWINITNTHGATAYEKCIIKKGIGTNAADLSYALLMNPDGTLKFVVSMLGTGSSIILSPNVSSLTPVPVRRWAHILLSSNGSTTELYIDGKYNHTYPFTPTLNVTQPLYIGEYDISSGPVSYKNNFVKPLQGYLSNLRIRKGENIYASSIDTPVTAFADNNVDDPYFDSVSLLLHGSGADNSSTITDSSTNNYLLSANGNCKITTTNQQFDYTSIQFDGVGDYISSLAFKDAGVFNLDDFTVEFWIFADNAPQKNQNIISFNKNPLKTGFSIKYTLNSIDILVGNSIIFTEKTRWSLNSWHYIAISRVASRLNIFINGDFVKSIPFNYNCTDGLQYIGREYNIANNYTMSGYIDDLRITKNVGRYNSNFTVPTTPLAAPINTGIILQAPYVKNEYGIYGVDGVHIGGSINKSIATPVSIELDNSVTLYNLFIHNYGTLYIPNTSDVALNIIGPKGLQITSEGVLKID